jgi:outer membrane lipoprotein-sorting protein
MLSNITRRTALLLTLMCFHSAGVGINEAHAAPSAEEILQKADEVRNPSDSFAMTVDVETKGEDDARFDVKIKGKDKTLIKTLKPARDVGRNMLMLDENMWSYVPNLKRAVRVSLNQKLTGQAANGDISRMRWHGDYDAVIEKETKAEWVLHLKARKKGLTYERIRVWIKKNKFHPSQAEYLSGAGKVLKNASFSGYKNIAGAVRPTVILITDATDRSKASRIIIRSMADEDFPNSLFHQNSLK